MNKKIYKKILLGEITVDAGMIAIVDPCYIDKGLDYDSICDLLSESPAGEFIFSPPYGKGIISRTLNGDGVFPVWGYFEKIKNHGYRATPSRILIDFEDNLEELDEEDELC